MTTDTEALICDCPARNMPFGRCCKLEPLAALRAQLAEAQKDAGRLDYIQKNARCDPRMDGNHVWWPTSFNKTLKGPTIRAAIDAAKGEQ